MADFKQAIIWLREGRKIIRSQVTKNSRYLYLKSGTGDWSDYICLNNNDDPNTNGDVHSISLKELEATDWEIYEEEDNWNLLKYSYEIGLNNQLQKCENNDKFILSDIKILKEKLLQDFKNLQMSSYDDEDVKLIINKRFGDIK